ncbi:MAG: hypothetical protein ACM3H8_07605 [Sphingobacteriales bacterium]
MARANNSLLLHKVRGKIGDQIVVKQYGKKTVISKYPDMSSVKPSKPQKKQRGKFGKAVAYAQEILYNPVKKAAYSRKLKKGEDVYHYAMKEFFAKLG